MKGRFALFDILHLIFCILRKLPLRTCISCRIIKPQSELIRLAIDNENKIVIDKEQKMGGRGVYVCNQDCFKQAAAKNLLSRAFRKKVTA